MFAWSEVCGERPAVMGIVNVTPDSFSDGGRFLDPDAAVAHGLALVAAGADLLDVGGESTRPGADPVGEVEELRRVLPVVERLAAEAGVPVSIDTSKAAVAAAALAAGARVVNDVAAGGDAEMFGAVAEAGAGLVVMHMLGEPRTMQHDPHYDDVVVDVGDFLARRLAAARDAGVHAASLCADPGLGFGKTAAHNLELLARMRELVARVDVPVLVGPSRKSFIARVLGDDVVARDDGTLATAVWAVDHGARIVRVHDAGAAADALHLLAVMDAIDADSVARGAVA
jgi:dihydropteroate synthase